ncbi:DUF4382 domain-containing protein [Solitalea koreensis]|uniref:DUF4382 domain-containing protein n=1 Tax=Solitalea koreensis TaxID=543615 RepID=A0A521BDY3_9SPHI|nr:DUF4382 domain-containing protein [Solitalea koreensis]SMO45284.1 protein of unknown function [Solitalea koreensis]
MKKNLLLSAFALAAGMVFFTACQKETSTGTTRLNVRMTDAPGNYEQINLSVKEIVVTVGDTTYRMESGKTFNILDFKAGSATPDILVASEEVPTGSIKEVRLLLNETGNSIKVDGQTYDLKIPSGYSSGWKVKLNEAIQLTDGIAYSLLLDFDAAKSIVHTGSGSDKYLLKPIVRGIVQATSGILTGVIKPITVQAKVYAINENKDTVGTVSDITTGKFSIGGLKAGLYKVSFDTQDTTYRDTILSNVNIKAGITTKLDTMALRKK